MTVKYGIIFNPNAGKKQQDKLHRLRARLQEAGFPFLIFETKADEGGAKPTKEAIHSGCTAIIGCGGDGTLNEIGSAIVGYPGISLGILPSGSGNDIARSQKLPLDTDTAIDRILSGHPVFTDCGFANEYFFLNIASIGFDAEVVQKKKELSKMIPPHLGYYLSVFLLMFSYREHKMRIVVNETVHTEKILLCAVGIGNFYGGGIEILPDAVTDDGLFEIRFIQQVTNAQRIRLIPALGSREHLQKFDCVKTYKSKSIEIQTEIPTYLNIDGEIIPNVRDTIFQLKQNAIQILK